MFCRMFGGRTGKNAKCFPFDLIVDKGSEVIVRKEFTVFAMKEGKERHDDRYGKVWNRDWILYL